METFFFTHSQQIAESAPFSGCNVLNAKAFKPREEQAHRKLTQL